jgi:AraC family transcriptional regulator
MNIVSQATVNTIAFTEILYEEGLRIPAHVHPTAGFCFVVDGEYVERYSSRTLDCRKRTVTFSPAGAEHANAFTDQRSHCFTIDMPAALMSRLALRLDVPFEVHGGVLPYLAARLLDEFLGPDEASPLVMEGLVMEMLGHAARARQPRPVPHISAAIREARQLVAARYTETLPLAEIASAVGRHPVYVASEFRRCYGETIGEYVRRLRVDRASRALSESDIAITDLAAECGFANQSSFTRAFRRLAGITPAEYRRRSLRRGAKP